MKNLKKVVILFLSLALFVAMLSSCSGGNTDTAGDKKPWTVMVYLCGSDLESEYGSATENINELLKVSNTNNINFIVETGGSKEWQTDGVASDKLGRYIISDGELNLVEQIELASMGESSTLSDFLKWGAEKYPADKYMSVIWNHGGGSVSGAAFDELYENDSLNLKELSDGYKNSNINFEVIGFDTCLMASLENAAAIAPYGNYLVASEETEPGGGWAYDKWVEALTADTAMNGDDLGKVICDSYFEKCKSTEDSEMATLSVIDLKKVPQLVEAFDKMAGEMTGITGDITSLQKYAQNAIKAESYGGNTDEEGYTNMVDLGDLTLKTENVIENTSGEVLEKLDSCVIHSVNGTSRSNAKGISVFFPLGIPDTEELDNYAKYSTISGNYLKFISTFVPDWTIPVEETNNGVEVPSDTETVNPQDFSFNISTHITDDGFFRMKIDNEESIETVKFNLYYLDVEYNEYVYLGNDSDLSYYDDTQEYEDNFRGVWATLNDCYVNLNLIDEGDNYNLYSIPILLNDEETNLRAKYVWNDDGTGEYQIIGCWSGIDTDTGMSSKNIVKLKNGDVITVLMDGTNVDTDETSTYSVGEITVDDSLELTESSLFDGDYLYEYQVTDIFGNTQYSDTVVMTCDGEDLSISEI